ncbi:MAG: hypothetical protein PVF58_15485 [Candidatus Methanofastidiosia archaeon]|jgi:hypothetical protein
MSTFKIETQLLRDIFESFQEIYSEIILELKENGILILGRTPSHTVYMMARINDSILQNYTVSQCKKIVFDLTILKKFLSFYPKEVVDVIIKRNLIYIGEEKNFKFYVFAEEEFFDIPELEQISKCDLEKNDLIQSLNELKVFSDFFKLKTSNGNLELTGEDEIRGQGRILLNISEVSEKFEGIFPIQPLLIILDNPKIGKKVNLKFFKNNLIGFSFSKSGSIFNMYIIAHIL